MQVVAELKVARIKLNEKVKAWNESRIDKYKVREVADRFIQHTAMCKFGHVDKGCPRCMFDKDVGL